MQETFFLSFCLVFRPNYFGGRRISLRIIQSDENKIKNCADGTSYSAVHEDESREARRRLRAQLIFGLSRAQSRNCMTRQTPKSRPNTWKFTRKKPKELWHTFRVDSFTCHIGLESINEALLNGSYPVASRRIHLSISVGKYFSTKYFWYFFPLSLPFRPPHRRLVGLWFEIRCFP